MRRTLVVLLSSLLVITSALGTAARADIEDVSADNVQDGDNVDATSQAGSSDSGRTVGGQVAGVQSTGDASIDARNRSEDVDLESGAATGSNSAAAQTGQNVVDAVCAEISFISSADCDASQTITADVEDAEGTNVQHGDNDLTLTQLSAASSGDAIGGQVIGATAVGSVGIVADNSTSDVDAETGEAITSNGSSVLAGQTSVSASCLQFAIFAFATCTAEQAVGSDVEDIEEATNVQDGDDTATVDQNAGASSGDGIAGQVIGSISGGDMSIDARNRSEDSDIDTGLSDAANTASTQVGQASVDVLCVGIATESFADCSAEQVIGADIENATATNVQDGDNDAVVSQSADAGSGDGVAGQVIGAVTTAGGDAGIVADNATEDSDIDTGDASAANDADTLVGQSDVSASCFGIAFFSFATCTAASAVDVAASAADIEAVSADNVQEGDNTATVGQDVGASSGDGVAGQVVGAASSGNASIDARSRTEDADVDTGLADAANQASTLAGQSTVQSTCVAVGFFAFNTCTAGQVIGADVEDASGSNLQEGDNDADVTQSATASSGDAVGGQVVGVVTSAGGSAGIVVDNRSEDVDGSSGVATFSNVDATFVGQAFNSGTLAVG